MIVRGGGPSSGPVSTGFFGGMYLHYLFLLPFVDLSLGLTLGRVVLVEVTRMVNILYHNTLEADLKSGFNRSEPLTPSTFIPSSLFCKLRSKSIDRCLKYLMVFPTNSFQLVV